MKTQAACWPQGQCKEASNRDRPLTVFLPISPMHPWPQLPLQAAAIHSSLPLFTVLWAALNRVLNLMCLDQRHLSSSFSPVNPIFCATNSWNFSLDSIYMNVSQDIKVIATQFLVMFWNESWPCSCSFPMSIMIMSNAMNVPAQSPSQIPLRAWAPGVLAGHYPLYP